MENQKEKEMTRNKEQKETKKVIPTPINIMEIREVVLEEIII